MTMTVTITLTMMMTMKVTNTEKEGNVTAELSDEGQTRNWDAEGPLNIHI